MEEGVLVGGKLVSDVRFADDQGMVASTEMGLQTLMNKLNDTAINYGMNINVQKTKTMVVRWNGGGIVNITVDRQRIEQVKKFKHLDSIITEEERSDVYVKSRIAMAKDAFNQRNDLLTRGLSRTLKKRMIKVLVGPVVLYGCETWTLLQDEINRLQALEMWLWRGLEKISWSDKMKNEDVLKRVEEKSCLIRTISQRKKNWIGHVLRGDGLLRDVMEGRVMGKRRQGQPRRGMISDLEEATRDLKKEDGDSSNEEDNDPGGREECVYVKMKRMVGDRERWREWVPGTGLRAEDQ